MATPSVPRPGVTEPEPGTEFWRARVALFDGTGCDGATVEPPPGWRPWEAPRLPSDHPAIALDRAIEILAGRSRSNSCRPRTNSVRLDRDHLASLGVPCPHYALRFHVAHAVWVAAREEEDAARAKRSSPEAMDLARIIEGARLAAASATVAVANIETVAAWDRADLARSLTPPPAEPVDARPDYEAWNTRQADIIAALDALAALGPALDALRAAVPALTGLSTVAEEHRADLIGPGADGHVWERAFARVILAVLREWTGRYPDTGKGVLHILLDGAAEAIGRPLPASWSRPAALARKDLDTRPAWDRPGTRAEHPPGIEPAPAVPAAERRRDRDAEVAAVAEQIVRQRADLAGWSGPLDPDEVAQAAEQVATAFGKARQAGS